MRKLTSILLCLVLLVGSLAVNVSAISVNHTTDFDNAIGSIYLRMQSQKSVAEGEMFPLDIVMERAYYAIDKIEQYGYGEPEVSPGGEKFYSLFQVPASVLESAAQSRFSAVDQNKLRTYTYYAYDAQTQTGQELPSYDAATNAYIIPFMGGYGDSAYSDVQGYVENNNGTFTVYSFCADHGYEPKAGDAEGKDYFYHKSEQYNENNELVEVDCCDSIDGYLKVVVSIKGKTVKFHSWERSETEFAKTGDLITPDMVPTTTTKATTTVATTTTTVATTATTTATTVATTTTDTTTTTTTVPTGPATVIKPIASTDGAILQAAQEVFPEGTVVKVETVTEEKVVAHVETALKETTKKFVAYEITATSDNVAVQPNGTVLATFDIPAEFDAENTVVFYIADDGSTEELSCTVDTNNRTVTATLSHFSTYAVVEAVQAEDDGGSSNSAVMWILLIVGILLVAGAVAIILLVVLRKKGDR